MLHSGWLAWCDSCQEIIELGDGNRRSICSKGHRLVALERKFGYDAYGWYEYRKKAGKWKLMKIDETELRIRIQKFRVIRKLYPSKKK